MNRFDAVRELVKDPSLRVTEIAWKTGYNKGHVSRLRKAAMRQELCRGEIMSENKNAKTSADGPVAWGCQCGRAYTVTCISIKPTKQEPVAWLKTWSDGSVSVLKIKSHLFTDHELEPLYAAPPRKEWVGLTDDEIQDLSYLSQKIDASNAPWFDRWGFARAIEAKLKEKNQ